MVQGSIQYLHKDGSGIVKIKVLEVVDYDIPQLDKIKKKVDRILELLEVQDSSTNYSNVRASSFR